MKRFFLVLASLLGVFLFTSCSVSANFDTDTAIQFFLQWLVGQGIPENPDTPMAGFLLGQVGAGSVVSAHVPAEENASRASAPLEENGWLFYLDEAPRAFYGHPGRILVVGQSGKVLYADQTQGWPTVDGECPEALDSPSSDAYYQAMVWNPWNLLKPVFQEKTWSPAEISLSFKGAIVWNGISTNQPLYHEASNMHAQVLADMKAMYGDSRVVSLTNPTSPEDAPAYRLRAAINQLIFYQNVSVITLYIIAHGGVGVVEIADGGLNVDGFRYVFREYPDITFAFLLESCNSGNFVTRLSGDMAEDNVDVMIASTYWNQGAYADEDTMEVASPERGGVRGWVDDYNPEDAYAEWSSDFLMKLAAWTTGDRWAQVQEYARMRGIDPSFALYYHCFWDVKGSPWFPPLGDFVPGETTWTLRERSGIDKQTPRIYVEWEAEVDSNEDRS